MPKKIFVDQGHNPTGPNGGAEANGLREQDITYAVGTLLAQRLNDNPDFEARVSRSTPDQVLGSSNSGSLSARVRAANSWQADLFVSIHTNSVSNPQANGTESLVYSQSSPAYTVATAITDNIVRATGFRNRGVKLRPELYVLRRTAMPAVLIELGFISNPSEAYYMARNPGIFADAVYRAIVSNFGII